MNKSFGIENEKIHQYAIENFKALDPSLIQALDFARKAGLPEIQVGPMDGLHIEVLTRICQAKTAVEIGTLGGFSGTYIARGLAPGGKLYTLEISDENARIAEKVFELTGVSDRVEILVGPALDSLQKIASKAPFDLAFVDADKANYPNYFKWAADHIRIGGLIIGDNTFAFGKIAEQNPGEEKNSVEALREFNRLAAQDPRFRSTILPTGEGLTVAVRIK